MTRWHEGLDALENGDIFDPLCVERSAPMSDEEAEVIETLCQAATPGPLVVDDNDAGSEGSPVASLPDGRVIVTLATPMDPSAHEAAINADAELFCKARYELLKLLRDRRQWKEQREFLQERIHTLETALGIRAGEEPPVVLRPR